MKNNLEIKEAKELEIVWSLFFNEYQTYIERNILNIQMDTSIPIGVPYRDTYAFYSVSLWHQFCRVVEKNPDKDPWELFKMLLEDSDESGKLRYNMMRNAKRDTIRDLLRENGRRRKSDKQIAKERKELLDYYKEMSPTHEGLGVEIFSSRDIKVNNFELKFKVEPKVHLLDLKISRNNVEDSFKEQEVVELLDYLLSSKEINKKNKELLLDLVLLDKESIRLKEGVRLDTLNKRIYRLKGKVKDILADMKNDVA